MKRLLISSVILYALLQPVYAEEKPKEMIARELNLTPLEKNAVEYANELLEGEIEAVISKNVDPSLVMKKYPGEHYLMKDIELKEKDEKLFSTVFIYNKEEKNKVYVIVFDYKKEENKNKIKKFAITGKDYSAVYEILTDMATREYIIRRETIGKEILDIKKIKPFEDLFDKLQNFKED